MDTKQFHLYITGYDNLRHVYQSKSIMIGKLIDHYQYWLDKPEDLWNSGNQYNTFKPKSDILESSRICTKVSSSGINQLISKLNRIGDIKS